jgi:hypothetical protein
MIEIEFTLEQDGHWLKAEVYPAEYADIMNSGNIGNQQICAVRIWSHEIQASPQEDLMTYYLVYDFVALDSDTTPAWRLTT